MRVRALVSFAGKAGSVQEGAVFELPDGVDWLTAGLVEVVVEPATEETTTEETATAPAPQAPEDNLPAKRRKATRESD